MSSIEPVVYEDLVSSRAKLKIELIKFSSNYHDYLVSALITAGFYNKLVRLKVRETVGQFRVDSSSYSIYRPWEIKFHPLTKNREVSMNARILPNFYPWKEDCLVEQLLDIAEVIDE